MAVAIHGTYFHGLTGAIGAGMLAGRVTHNNRAAELSGVSSGRIVPAVKFIAAMLGAMLVVLMPLAHASPIDPSTPGFWDGGDYDDVVLFLTAGLHFHAADDPPAIRLFAAPTAPRRAALARPPLQRAQAPIPPRSPPCVA